MNQSIDNRETHQITENYNLNPVPISSTDDQNTPICRMRTLKGLAAHYKRLDNETALTEHFWRSQILAGRIPFKRAGNKRLIRIEDTDAFLSTANTTAVPEERHEQILCVD